MIVMKIYLTIIALFFMSGILAQSNFERLRAYSYIIDPVPINPTKLDYVQPTTFKKGSLHVIFPMFNRFLNYDTSIIRKNMHAYGEFLYLFVLKDSVAYFDTAGVHIETGKDQYGYDVTFLTLSEKIDLQLYERVNILTNAMPVTSCMRFPGMSIGKYDAEMVICGDNWELTNNPKEMDTYADVLAMVIYDIIIERDAKTCQKIVIKTISSPLGNVIHQRAYNTSDRAFKSFYR
jgi:hypothetical protein